MTPNCNQTPNPGDAAGPAGISVCRRGHERTPLRLHGSYLTRAGDTEMALIVADVSPGGARLLAADIPTLDAEVVMKISGLGCLTGRVVRTCAQGFSVQFTDCSDERQRMAASIAWNFNKSRLGLANRRGAGPEPVDACDPVEFSDGQRIDAEITELTLSGAAFRCARAVTVGEPVRIGALSGSVAQVMDDGFAVVFDPPAPDQAPDQAHDQAPV
jgi:hypothetical protein